MPPATKHRHTPSAGRQGAWSSPTLSALRRSRLVTDFKRTEFVLPETTSPRHTASFGRTDTWTTTSQSSPERSSSSLDTTLAGSGPRSSGDRGTEIAQAPGREGEDRTLPRPGCPDDGGGEGRREGAAQEDERQALESCNDTGSGQKLGHDTA